MVGMHVSHAHNRTKRRFNPNLVQVSLYSETLDRTFPLKIAASTLRTVEHRQGLDNFLSNARRADLSQKARRIKRQIDKHRAAGEGTAALEQAS